MSNVLLKSRARCFPQKIAHVKCVKRNHKQNLLMSRQKASTQKSLFRHWLEAKKSSMSRQQCGKREKINSFMGGLLCWLNLKAHDERMTMETALLIESTDDSCTSEVVFFSCEFAEPLILKYADKNPTQHSKDEAMRNQYFVHSIRNHFSWTIINILRKNVYKNITGGNR